MDVVLIGYRGSGKSTLGKKLADRLWSKFYDLDDMIVAKSGKTIREVFEKDGEERFRQIESECLAEALKIEAGVLALGGGAIVRPENRQMLKDAGVKVIYLRCEPKVLLERIASDTRSFHSRPNLTSLGGGIEEIETLLAQREPLYREAKTAELEVTNLTPDEAVVYVARMM